MGVKLGLNLLKLRQTGRVTFYDGLKLIPKLFEESESDIEIVKKIYDDIKAVVSEDTLIMVDQVSLLLHLGIDTKNVYALCHYLSLLPLKILNVQLVLRMFESNNADNNLVNQVHRLGVLNIKVEGLQTGLSRDVSGVITFNFKDKDDIKLQYKTFDKEVKIFAPGTCKAVL